MVTDVKAMRVTEPDNLEEASSSTLMNYYKVLKIDEDGIDLDISFNNPLEVSMEENPDLLVVMLDLSGF